MAYIKCIRYYIREIGERPYKECRTNVVKETAGETESFRLSTLGIDEAKYSSQWKLLRITAICLKFIKYRVWSKCSQALQERLLLKCGMLRKLFNDIRKQLLYYTRFKILSCCGFM